MPTQEEKLTQLVQLLLSPILTGRVEVERAILTPEEVKLRFHCFIKVKDGQNPPFWPWSGSEKEYHAEVKKQMESL